MINYVNTAIFDSVREHKFLYQIAAKAASFMELSR